LIAKIVSATCSLAHPVKNWNSCSVKIVNMRIFLTYVIQTIKRFECEEGLSALIIRAPCQKTMAWMGGLFFSIYLLETETKRLVSQNVNLKTLFFCSTPTNSFSSIVCYGQWNFSVITRFDNQVRRMLAGVNFLRRIVLKVKK